MHTKHLITGAIFASTLLVSASAYAKTLSAQDFVTKASISDKFEIESSQMALDKSQDADVKKFAQQMIDDHTKASNKLKDTIQSSNSDAQPAEDLDAKHQRLINKLQSASGSDFDKQYVSMQDDGHKDAVKLFKNYSKGGKDDNLKKFASNTLPTLEEHLHHVEQLKSSH